MISLTLRRTASTADGTPGLLLDAAGNRLCHTIEPPWRDNQSNISCIPAGEYPLVEHFSQKFGRVLMLTGVPGRSWIYIHAGNLAGDRAQGKKSHSYGCILPGRRRGWLFGQRAVLASRVARALIEELVAWKPATLHIEWEAA